MISLNTDLWNIDWGRHRARILGLFFRMKISTLRELLSLEGPELSRQKNVGRVTCLAIAQTLTKFGLLITWERGKKLWDQDMNESDFSYPKCPHCGKALKIIIGD